MQKELHSGHHRDARYIYDTGPVTTLPSSPPPGGTSEKAGPFLLAFRFVVKQDFCMARDYDLCLTVSACLWNLNQKSCQVSLQRILTAPMRAGFACFAGSPSKINIKLKILNSANSRRQARHSKERTRKDHESTSRPKASSARFCAWSTTRQSKDLRHCRVARTEPVLTVQQAQASWQLARCSPAHYRSTDKFKNSNKVLSPASPQRPSLNTSNVPMSSPAKAVLQKILCCS